MTQPAPLDGTRTSPEWNLYQGGIAVWPVGAFEQHGRHLPLETDTLTATYFARRVAARLGGVVLPALTIGTSLEQAGFRGSLSLTPELLMALVRNMADELEKQNFTRLIIVNGHGGNFALYPAARAVNRDDRPIKVLVKGIGDVLDRDLGDGCKDLHAGKRETSVMLHLYPELVGDDRIDAAPDLACGFDQSDLTVFGFGRIVPEGCWGRPSEATAELGAQLCTDMENKLVTWAERTLAELDRDPRYGGPGRVSLRPMARADWAVVLRLARLASWNQLDADGDLLLRDDSRGFVAVHQGLDVGTATVRDYGGVFCWIGMVLVDPAMRRRGIGTVLLHAALGAAPSQARLDATPAGRELYLTLGFTDEYTLSRLECAAAPGAFTVATPAGVTCRAMTAADLDAVVAYDAATFGVARASVLDALRQRRPDLAWVATRSDGAVVGYSLGRDGHSFTQVGPILAQSDGIAQSLAAHALGRLSGKRVIIDAFDDKSAFTRWLSDHGFTLQRPFIRMYRGSPPPGSPAPQYAIAGPELG